MFPYRLYFKGIQITGNTNNGGGRRQRATANDFLLPRCLVPSLPPSPVPHQVVNELRSTLLPRQGTSLPKQRLMMNYCLINVIVVEVPPLCAVRKYVPAKYDLPISIV